MNRQARGGIFNAAGISIILVAMMILVVKTSSGYVVAKKLHRPNHYSPVQLLMKRSKDDIKCCFYPDVSTFQTTMSQVYLHGNYSSTSYSNFTTFIDNINYQYRSDQISIQNDGSLYLTTEYQFKISNIIYYYSWSNNNGCSCRGYKNQPWFSPCYNINRDIPFIKTTLGNLQVNLYSKIDNNKGSGVNTDNEMVVDLGNNKCWLISSQQYKIDSNSKGLWTINDFGHSLAISDRSVFKVPSNCPQYTSCKIEVQ
ncbi:hypothetical protein ABK040_013128 [Willaertia magna]